MDTIRSQNRALLQLFNDIQQMKITNSSIVIFFSIAYFVILHGFVLVVLLKTDIIQQIFVKLGATPISQEVIYFRNAMITMQHRIDKNLPDNQVIFIGDSITQGLAVSAVTSNAVNFGIGHDTTTGVLERISSYKSIKRARGVVLAIGINDINKRDNEEILGNFKRIIELIPEHIPIVISELLPVNEVVRKQTGFNRRIDQINEELEKYCIESSRLSCLDTGVFLLDSSGNLSKEYHIGDGVHLNPAGYSIWINNLKKFLTILL